jgi:hypothetical protein
MARGVLIMNLHIDDCLAEAAEVSRNALEEARRSNDGLRIGIASYFQAFSFPRSEADERVAALERAHDAYSSVGFTFGLAYTLLAMGEATFETGDASGALRCATQAQGYFQRVNDHAALALVRGNISKYLASSNTLDLAREAAFDALTLAQQAADPASIAIALQPFAWIAINTGSSKIAASLLGAANRLLDLARRHRVLFAKIDYDRLNATIAAAMPNAEIRFAANAGCSWDLSQIVAVATAL